MKIGSFLSFFAIQFLVLLLMLEGGIRVSSTFSDKLSTLLYIPELAREFADANSIQELLGGSLLQSSENSERKLNTRGFFTKEYSHSKPTGSIRIAGIGDSFTYAGGIERNDTWWAVSERELQSIIAPGVEVFGLGVQGTGTAFQRRIWEFEKGILNADLVVLAFYVGNDFRDNIRDGTTLTGISGWILKYSYLSRLIRNSLLLPKELWTGDKSRKRKKGKQNRKPDVDGEVSGRKQFLIFSRSGKTRSSILAQSVEEINLLRQEVELAGSKFTVMIIPAAFQVNTDLQIQITDRLGIPPDFPQDELTKALDERRISYLNLLPAFQRERKNQQLYRHRDIHWNESGHKLAGSELAKFLVDRKLVEQ